MKKTTVLHWLGRTITLIPIGKLRIEPKYQRKLDKANLQRINNPLREDALRIIVVSLRADGFYYILDGQHRFRVMEAAFKAGQTQYAVVGAEVHTGLSLAKEAELFVALNDTKYVTPTYKFRANLRAGRKLEKDIQGIVSTVGLTIKLGSGRPKVGESVITALGILQWIYNTYDREVLVETLETVSEGFRNEDGSVQKTAVMAQFLKGLASYLHNNNKNASDVLPFIGSHTADDFYDAAKQRVKSHRSDPWVEIAKEFDLKVNRKRKAA
jgi:hypothetical protein